MAEPSELRGRPGWSALGLAGLLAVAVWVVRSAGSADRSSTSLGPEGTAALAGVLGRMGHEVESVRLGLHVLSNRPMGSVLFLPMAPGLVSTGIGASELARLEQFVRAGSTAVVLTHYTDPVTEWLGREYAWRAIDGGGAEGPPLALPVLPEPLVFGGGLQMEGRGGLKPHGGDDVLFAVGEVPVVVRRRDGDGTWFLVADPGTATNRTLGRAGNLAFYTALVERHLGPGGRVMFDDLHAGAGDSKGLVAWARGGGLLPSLLALVLLVAAWIWSAGLRFGAILPAVGQRAARPTTDLVGAVATVYERAGLQAHALAVMSRRFRRRLERHAGRSWSGGQLNAWVQAELGESAGRDLERIRRRLGELLADPSPRLEDVRAAAALLHHFETAYLTGHRLRRGGAPRRQP